MSATYSTRVLAIDGSRLLLDGQPFYFQGLSFFNAIYNPTFNRSEEERRRWLATFQANGVNALRVWCQWDFTAPRIFVDVAPERSMYNAEGEVQVAPLSTLTRIIEMMDSLGMVIEVTLFSHEKQPNLPVEAQERAARGMAERLRPYRNLILQIWNEDSTEVLRFFEAIKAVDPERIVTNSPGFAGELGDEAQNRALDLLTPHTARTGVDRFWEVAPQQIATLLERYGKPVIDDEPARNGTIQFGGIPGGTQPGQHIEQIRQVRALGGYHIYHHDMFQYGYGHPAIPPSGLPDPDFSPFHRQVLDYLRENPTW
jgi:hypothetical protein